VAPYNARMLDETCRLRDLVGVEDYARVVALEQEIWGESYGDVVPVALLAVTIKRGGILIGAFDASDRLVGFVYSLVGLKDDRPIQWSHMLGVVAGYRGSGLGRQLKLAQRRRALDQGLDLIEWTFDPLQAANAHLNLHRLGAVADEYFENVYGASSSPLHGRLPTDRLVASWHIADPHVERRLDHGARLDLRAAEIRDAPVALSTTRDGAWLRPDVHAGSSSSDRVLVQVPLGFTDLLREAPALAADWRSVTREILTGYLSRGYRVVDFFLDQARAAGSYLLATRGLK